MAIVPLLTPRVLAQFTARLLLAARHPCGSRALTCCRQAVPGLWWFRDGASPGALASDHGISRATACRFLDEVIVVLGRPGPGVARRRCSGPEARAFRM